MRFMLILRIEMHISDPNQKTKEHFAEPSFKVFWN
jgi:hypothetical protein